MKPAYVQFLPMSSFNTSGLSTSYQELTTTAFADVVCFIRIINASNKDITISYDGATDHDYVPSATVAQLGLPQPVVHAPSMKVWRKGTKIYLKGASTGTGLVYVAAYY